MQVKLIDKSIYKKFSKLFTTTYIIFIVIYIIGFTIDNLGKLNVMTKIKNFSIFYLYLYNILMAVFYIFPFATIFSTIFLYLYVYLKKENVSILIIGYKCKTFKTYTLFSLFIAAICAFMYYDFVFTNTHTKDRKLMISFKQNNKYFNPIMQITHNDNQFYILGKVYYIDKQMMENVYFYNITKAVTLSSHYNYNALNESETRKIEVFAKKLYIHKNYINFYDVKIFKKKLSFARKRLRVMFPNISKEFLKIFTTIEGLNSLSLINFYNATTNKTFLFELFKRISYIVNGVFIAFLLINAFTKIIVKVEMIEYITYFVLLTIIFISLYFFIFLLAKNLYNLYIGIILWIWSLSILSLSNKKLINYEQ